MPLSTIFQLYRGSNFFGTGYEYDGNVFVAWVLQVRRAEVVRRKPEYSEKTLKSA